MGIGNGEGGEGGEETRVKRKNLATRMAGMAAVVAKKLDWRPQQEVTSQIFPNEMK